ncbi:MAG: cob(I)yrinic acid a,c-diamide adenosyltransferase [Thermoleophilia bacterium]|nr:cob(I)yrinic acid a,c-diamide adenosyltransferase [Thermoleophilia bacterium]
MSVLGKKDGAAGNPSSQYEEHDRLARVLWEQARGQGLVHLYTGNGKGKTTAALGLALRALGRDRKVVIIQFLKRTTVMTGEMVFAEKMGGPLKIRQFGASRFATREEQKSVEESGQTVERGWEFAREMASSAENDLVVLDEITHVVKNGQIALKDLISLVKDKARSVELVLTGRYAPPELQEVCDYVTEMREIKHPYHNGVRAREGTEF